MTAHTCTPTCQVICAMPHCGHQIPGDSDFLVLTVPDLPLLAFCSLKHLAVWCAYHGPTGWRDAGTAWADRPIED